MKPAPTPLPAAPTAPDECLGLPPQDVQQLLDSRSLALPLYYDAQQDAALLPGLLQGLARWVPDLDLVPVPQASHWIVHEQPALVVATIKRLLV